jgi:hypothetical protein
VGDVIPITGREQHEPERLARDSRHPVTNGGPHAATLTFIREHLVPAGYREGLWMNRRGVAAHAITPATVGVADAYCGLRVLEPRRADTTVPLCRRCFPD